MKNREQTIKKFESTLKQQQPWFQDEMRYGTRTIPARRWTAQGHRPTGAMKYGYNYSYLYQAIQPATGKTFEMYLPNMSGTCFKMFITEFAKVYPDQLMIMDNAGCHHVKWEEADGQKPAVNIAYLSAYSPDFNPQERVFQEIKKPLKGEVFKNTEQIEAVINEQLKKLWEQPELVKQLTAWEWIV